MRNPLSILMRVVAVLGGLLVLLGVLVVGALWQTLPSDSDVNRITGLSAPVEIAFDVDGIPRIRAGSDRDAAAALGYIHARDRLFQMDMMRRAASGRLSEIAGPRTLRNDRLMRVLGLRRSAIADVAALPPETRAVLDGYASGVNAWIAKRGRFAAPEFLLLGAPERWEPADSLLWGKVMGLWLSGNWRTELSRQALAARLDLQSIRELWPTPRPPTAGPDAALPVSRRFADAASRLFSALPAFPEPWTLPATASNEWAVDGRHTVTGAPLLAGDPHLGYGFPGLWYLARIELPDHALAGATAPGVPFIILGHNGRIAWSLTTTGADTQDVFIETPAGPGLYQTPDGPRPFDVREERIQVEGQPDDILTIRETRHGPVFSDLDAKDDGPEAPVLAVAMAGLKPGDTAATGLLALNHAASVQEAGLAAARISAPVNNLLVADRQTIGLFTTGRVPVRAAGDGSAPVPGDGSHDWTGYAAGNDLPHIVGPASGRLVNANEPVALPGFGIVLGGDPYSDWRARRIRALLDMSDRHTADGFAHMQIDTVSLFAQEIVPTLRAVPAAEGLPAQAQALLKGWDGGMAMELPQPLIFNAWVMRFYDLVIKRAGLAPRDTAPEDDFIAFVLSPPGAHWCGGDCTALLRQALAESTTTLAQRYGADPTAWRWGSAHQAIFAHPMLGAIPVLKDLTTLSIDSPGDFSTIDRGGINGALQAVHGPEFRGVYDLADLSRSVFIVAPGQSGNPLSHHARDFLRRWRDGATIMLGPLSGAYSATIRLEP